MEILFFIGFIFLVIVLPVYHYMLVKLKLNHERINKVELDSYKELVNERQDKIRFLQSQIEELKVELELCSNIGTLDQEDIIDQEGIIDQEDIIDQEEIIEELNDKEIENKEADFNSTVILKSKKKKSFDVFKK